MTFLPIVARELRVTSRKVKTYWGRTGIAASMLFLAGWVFVISHRGAASEQAMTMFATLTGAMLFVGGFAGMAATADTLSSEKREGTLGLLFLTPLRGYDVVFGKLVTGSVNVLYGLLSVMPIMALPVLLGGVSGGEFTRMSLLLVNTMLLSLSIGIGVSSISRDEKRARGSALLLMLLFAGGGPLVGAWLEYEMKVAGAASLLCQASPGYAFTRAWDSARVVAWGEYWTSMMVMHALTWLFLILACGFTPRTWQDRAARRKWWILDLFRTSHEGRVAGGTAFRKRLLNQNAFYWLAVRPRHRGILCWVMLLVITAVWVGFGFKYPRDMFSEPMFIFMALIWNGIIKAWIASESTRQIASDRKSGSIELLLSTPLTTRDISQGVWLSLKRQVGAILLLILCAEFCLLVIGATGAGGADDRIIWVSVWICGMTMLVADVIALYVVGLWQSAVAKGPTEAAGATGFRILVLPWILYMLLGATVVIAENARIFGRMIDTNWVFWLGSWALIGFGVDWFFGWRAWRSVQSQFREAASQRGAARGWGDALGRLFGRAVANRTLKR